MRKLSEDTKLQLRKAIRDFYVEQKGIIIENHKVEEIIKDIEKEKTEYQVKNDVCVFIATTQGREKSEYDLYEIIKALKNIYGLDSLDGKRKKLIDKYAIYINMYNLLVDVFWDK